MTRCVAPFGLVLGALLCLSASAGPAAARTEGELTGTLKKVDNTAAVTIGYRESSIPFSFLTEAKRPVGYAIDICLEIVDDIARELGRSDLAVKYQPVTSENRFAAVSSGEVDLECGSTTATLERRSHVDFSPIDYISATKLLVRRGSQIRSYRDLGGRKVAVTAGTTNADALRALFAQLKMSAELVEGRDHADSFQMVKDGRGDVSGKSFDLGYRAVDHDHGWLMLGAADLGIPVPASRAADMLLALAREFLTVSRLSGDVWHVRELPSWTTSVPGVRTLNLPLERTDVPLGAVGGAASVQVPLGSLTPAQAATIEASTAARVVITPSRGLVLPGAAGRLPELVAAGLIDDASSPWSAISACVGAPSCQKSLIDTRTYATTLAESGHPLPRTHVSGCERRCGAPAGAHHDLVAPDAASPLLLVGESM